MGPHAHLDDALLHAHAAGTAGEALSLLAASHATLCPSCRAALGALDDVGGELLASAPGAAVGDDVLTATLARLDDDVPETAPSTDPTGLFPAPLYRLLGSVDRLDWRRIPGGIRAVDLPIRTGDTPVRLLDLPPGLRVPPHEHTGVERILVLRGGFTDDVGHFGRGDVSVREDPSVVHLQVIDPGDRCFALVFAEGPLVPKTLWGRFLGWWSGI